MALDQQTETPSHQNLPFRAHAQVLHELRQQCPGLAILGSSLTHLRHSIPEDQAVLFQKLAKNSSVSVPAFSALAKKSLLLLLAAFYETGVLITLKLRWGKSIRQALSQPYDLVLKTWCPNLESIDKPTDFYFGDLERQLTQRQLKVLLLAGNGKADQGTWRSKLDRPFQNAALAKEMFNRKVLHYFPEFALISVAAPLRFAFQQIQTAFRLRAIAQQTKSAPLKIAAASVAADVLRPYTLQNMLHFEIGATLARCVNPKVCIHLYEGKPWESLFRLGVRSVASNCRLVGYQHTIVMPHSLEVTEPDLDPTEGAAPDVVLCLGPATLDLLAPGHAPLKTMLLPFGSFRFTYSKEQSPQPDRRTVLVLPEGIPSEAILLFNGAMELAARLPDHRFIFRSHPVLPFHIIRPQLRQDPQAFTNIELSTRPAIEEDYARASVVLYRGSSTILYALLRGIKPLYFDAPGTANIDPLYALSSWRETADDAASATALLQRYANSPENTAQEDWVVARNFANRYMIPVTSKSIDQFLATLRTSGGSL